MCIFGRGRRRGGGPADVARAGAPAVEESAEGRERAFARGASGGYRLGREPSRITIGQVIRAVDGPPGAVRGLGPDGSRYPGASANLPRVWVAMRAAVAEVLDTTTLEQVRTGELPDPVAALVDAAGSGPDRP